MHRIGNFCLFVCIFSITTLTFAQADQLKFESAEHIFIGEQVTLQGLPTPPAGQLFQFPLQNGITLSYGELIAMPDYYGDPNHHISDEPTFEGRKQEFLTQFNHFSAYNPAYFNAFWPIIQDEQAQVAAALKNHQPVSALYQRITGKEIIALNKATKGRFLALASTCYDHFGHDAWLAYQAGHSDAIDTAIHGYNIAVKRDNHANATCATAKAPKDCIAGLAQNALLLAYEENAYANHFLTDRMAAGHMRTPYRALYAATPIPQMGGIGGGYMHNEDNRYGVIVTNDSGKYWMAYGDDYYFSDANRYHKAVIQTVIQASADEIYEAFKKGYNTDPLSVTLHSLLPTPIDPGETVNIAGLGTLTQSAPLFTIISDSVWERRNVNDRNDDEWVPNWSILKLILTYKLNKMPTLWQYYLSVHPKFSAIFPKD